MAASMMKLTAVEQDPYDDDLYNEKSPVADVNATLKRSGFLAGSGSPPSQSTADSSDDYATFLDTNIEGEAAEPQAAKATGLENQDSRTTVAASTELSARAPSPFNDTPAAQNAFPQTNNYASQHDGHAYNNNGRESMTSLSIDVHSQPYAPIRSNSDASGPPSAALFSPTIDSDGSSGGRRPGVSGLPQKPPPSESSYKNPRRQTNERSAPRQERTLPYSELTRRFHMYEADEKEYLRYPKSRDLYPQGSRLFIRNFDMEKINKRKVFDHFGPYGKIVEIRITSYVFVQYTAIEHAERAMAAMHSRVIDSEPLYVVICFPQTRDNSTRGSHGQHGEQSRSYNRDRESRQPHYRSRSRSPGGYNQGRNGYGGQPRRRSPSPAGRRPYGHSRQPSGASPSDTRGTDVALLADNVSHRFLDEIENTLRRGGLNVVRERYEGGPALEALSHQHLENGTQGVVIVDHNSQIRGQVDMRLFRINRNTLTPDVVAYKNQSISHDMVESIAQIKRHNSAFPRPRPRTEQVPAQPQYIQQQQVHHSMYPAQQAPVMPAQPAQANIGALLGALMSYQAATAPAAVQVPAIDPQQFAGTLSALINAASAPVNYAAPVAAPPPAQNNGHQYQSGNPQQGRHYGQSHGRQY